ncbi:hypothetical protein HED51_22350 [Ochrobactrum grignonense]|nr:hypothetical protein [Brucella grignonensis]
MTSIQSVEFLDNHRNRKYSAFIEFSGALSDTGNYDSIHGPSPAPFFEGRTTNGAVAGELVAQKLGYQADASMHLVGSVKGNNFAVRDAMASGDRPEDLSGQVSAYLDSVDGVADSDALFFVFNGGNDVIQAILTQDNVKSVALILEAVEGLERALTRLVEAGAQHILAPDFIDASLLPLIIQKKDVVRGQLISEFFNRSYRRMLLSLEQKLKFKFIRWSFDVFFKNSSTRVKASDLLIRQIHSAQCLIKSISTSNSLSFERDISYRARP